MNPYEIIEHTADIGLKVNGATLKELFGNAAKGMFEIIAPGETRGKIHTKKSEKVRIKKKIESSEELLVEWLSELLYLFNKKEILFSDFKILELDNNGITGEISGAKTGLSKTTLQTEIKAVTFHGLKIEENKNGFSCNIIFDV